MTVRWLALVLVLASVAVTGGCARPSGGVARGSVPSPVRSGEIDRAVLAARAQRVLLPPAAVMPLGVSVEPEENIDYRSPMPGGSQTSEYCNRPVEDQGSLLTHVVHRRTWMEPGRILVISNAHGYGTITAAHAVETTRHNAGLCQQYVIRFSEDRKVTYELLGTVDPGALTGVDASYGRCVKTTGVNSDDPPVYACAVFLARRDLLSHVEVWTSASVDAARTALLALVPAAAAALTAG